MEPIEYKYVQSQVNYESDKGDVWTFDSSFLLPKDEEVSVSNINSGHPVLPFKVQGKLKHWKDGSERRYAVDSYNKDVADGSIWLSGLYFDPVLNKNRDKSEIVYDNLVLERLGLVQCLLTIKLCSETDYLRVKDVLNLSSAFYVDVEESFEKLKIYLEQQCTD